ncbi:transcriptional regulator [Ensifer sp. NM-2]|uniref:helix-turn-helix domain-containing protein n=1 Tax=Ensifer sp. NM-2 TaxID=2109730 RepID=UPI000D123779|nr:helix-turn-helix transcriptional regulator [Ensifer sp. NM-2]PSS64503.1 transcriptional regulator [Ensifer sp. NM-2]
MLTNDHGRRLRRMRLLRQMKQSHLGELMGVDQATVSRWERGILDLSEAQWTAVCRLLAGPLGSAQDVALKRLVESSMRKVHLVCDRTHCLLAASAPRQAEWRTGLSEFLGKSLLVYASPEILAADVTLQGLGWHDGQLDSLEIDTGPNADVKLPIFQGRMLWERIMLADGAPARLVTTIA